MSYARTILFAAACLVITPVGAFDNDGRYAAQGAESCSVRLALQEGEASQSTRAGDTRWLEGVIHAFNWLVPYTFQLLGESDLRAAMRWIDDFCRSKPGKDTADAVEAFEWRTLSESATRSAESA